MMFAYDKLYLEKARTAMGRMFDYGVNYLEFDLSIFFHMFTLSKTAEGFERGEPGIVVGKSGIELAFDVLYESGITAGKSNKPVNFVRSREYWAGWALAYYQWARCLSFSAIEERVSIESIVSLYNPYHEMDIRQFADKMDELFFMDDRECNLKILRRLAGLSQSKLSERSQVPLRTIQQYEQRQKNINKASAIYLVQLARTLYCRPEDLLEIEIPPKA